MQKHIKVYREFFKIGDQDPTPDCEACTRQGLEIHHITSRGLKAFDCCGKRYEDINHIYNLILLCRNCHNDAHGGKLSKSYLYGVHFDYCLKNG